MDDMNRLSELLEPMLSDPQTMERVRQAAEQMGLGGLLPGQNSSPEENTAVGDRAEAVHPPSDKRTAELPAEVLSAVTRLAPILSAPKEDDTTRLLSALRPFLSQPRAKRLDEAERLLSVTRVLSILKESKLI